MNRFSTTREYTAMTEEDGEALYDLYKNQRGFDPFFFGQWQIDYAECIASAFGLHDEALLDLGCAGGSNTEAFLRMGLDAWGVDICRYFVENSPLARGRLRCAPADKLPFVNESFDFVHSQQVFEHVPEANCTGMLEEARRVLVDGGVLFAGFVVADEAPEFSEDDDPTHINVKPMRWWLDLAEDCGFKQVPAFESALRCRPFFKEHRFDFAVWRTA